MTASTLGVLMLLILGWAVISERLARWNITAPLVFTVAGFLIANPSWGALPVDVEAPQVHLLAEVTLALLLFSDAARVDMASLRRNLRVPGRLLGIGLPLSVLLGSLAAALLFDDFTWALAGFIGAALAPTDAALSAQVINDARIPLRVRLALNVESGLNDGIVTPVVVFMLSVAAGQLGATDSDHADTVIGPLLELGIGILVGAVIGLGSAKLIALGSRRRWMLSGGRRLAALTVPLSSFALAVTLGGNGFIAAFVAGIAFGAALPRDMSDRDKVGELPELVGEVLSFGVWFIFGAALVPIAFEYSSGSTLVYAAVSLTLVRLLPVALALLGARQDKATVLFMGWFGPRGLASVVFALLAVEELGQSEIVGKAVSVVAFTVFLSVILHGVSAGPLGSRYAGQYGDNVQADGGPRARRQIHRQ
ncbi:sodium:proton antiporter [Cryobacterium adonitolivorans]|uniref:Sodium:proton antiporter n=1 Tax=Cryobacterium adonitolivorans TaxID=1259189 RepID=A0A4R8WFE2_9MICO|nr:cation:proton antiporter [Cryobacterium adonitolivorans]TFC06898.1 sodium:proton antiporter [Cryobacterium adonitolivorans]